MRSFLLVGAAAVAAALGCSASGDSPGGASAAATGASSSSSASSAASGGGGSASVGQGGGGAGQGGAAATSGQGGGAVTAAIASTDFYVNCQPIVAEDPVIGSFIATYANSTGANAKATILSAKLVFSGNMQTLGWPLVVAPSDSGNLAPGFMGDVAHQKQGAKGESGSPCDFCQGTWSLEVTWDVGGGQTVIDTSDIGPVSCVF